jgi:hypothetical protein
VLSQAEKAVSGRNFVELDFLHRRTMASEVLNHLCLRKSAIVAVALTSYSPDYSGP